MYHLGKYKEFDKMSDLICENYAMLLVMSRFGIALGFGEQSIGEVCRKNDVDKKTFLTVVNMLIDEERQDEIDTSLSVKSLIAYLRNSHAYFLDFRLPAIRLKLVEALNRDHNDVARAIIRYYDEYVAEVRKHMQYEEITVFPYVDLLLDGKKQQYHIEIFSKQHDHVDAKLSELKDIIIKYYPAKSSNELNSVLFDIFSCSRDLASHNSVEDHLFVPVIKALEQKRSIR
ncbi:MAG: hemerythrin domain-containing protein [Tannerella sp.]|jgi:regulator of cell morphogenesis and NO signaling|nr:hemerythrin domain-containing protein [Tannerella sp.]